MTLRMASRFQGLKYLLLWVRDASARNSTYLVLQDTVWTLQSSPLGILVHVGLCFGAFPEALDAFPQNFGIA